MVGGYQSSMLGRAKKLTPATYQKKAREDTLVGIEKKRGGGKIPIYDKKREEKVGPGRLESQIRQESPKKKACERFRGSSYQRRKKKLERERKE